MSIDCGYSDSKADVLDSKLRDLESELAKTQALLDEAVDMVEYLAERSSDNDDITKAIEFIKKYEGYRKGSK